MYSSFKKILYLFSDREKVQIGVIFLLILVGAAIETSAVGLVAPFIAILNNPEIIFKQRTLQTIYNFIGASSSRQFLLWATYGLIGFYFAKGLYVAILAYIQISFFNQKQIDISQRLLKAYLDRPYIFHLQRNSADLISNITSEVSQIFVGVISPFLILLTEMIVMTFVTILLITFEPISSAIAAISLFLSILIFNQLLRKQVSKQGLLRQQYTVRLIQSVNQSLGGIKETKVLGRENSFIEAYIKNNQILNRANLFVTLANQLPPLFIEAIVMTVLLLIIVFTILQGKEISAVLQTISLFAIAALRLMPSIKRILATLTTIRYFQASVNVVYQDLVALKVVQHQPKSISNQLLPVISFEREIQLQNIDYQYPNSKERSLKNISLVIPKGSTVGFVGSSGAGKTTIIDIILGLLTPSKGQVIVDGQDIQTNLTSWHQYLGYIPQSIYLSDDTIRNNIAFGVPEEQIVEIEVWAALEAAQLKEMVSDLPEQLDTFVGERGIRLSGGQRQRVGIARALYHNPDILVMDEATAALDNATEREFIEALEAMSGKKTIIMIAHRLSTVKNCDRLYLMQQGQIISSGSYNELLSQSNEFRSLANQKTVNNLG
jgi:ABC-type multidrug transport system fused ATPase/permease subunit